MTTRRKFSNKLKGSVALEALQAKYALTLNSDHPMVADQPGGDREMVDILALVVHHDEQAVLDACEMAQTEGVATKTHMLNLLLDWWTAKLSAALISTRRKP